MLDRSQPSEQIVTHPPIAVLEAMSLEDRIVGLIGKLNDYQGMEIPQIWLVFPTSGNWLRFKNGQLVTETEFLHGASGSG